MLIQPSGPSDIIAAGFSYRIPPSVISLSVSSGPASGGTPVTVTGNHFNVESGNIVLFGGTPATNVNVLSLTRLTAVTPEHDPGTVDVRVADRSNPDALNGTLVGGFVYQSSTAPPTDAYIDPSTVGPKGCGTADFIPSSFALLAALLWLIRRRPGSSARH